MPASTVPEMVASLARTDAARPLLTFYDDATGERVELSVATFANWVAKTASLALDDLDVEPGLWSPTCPPTGWARSGWWPPGRPGFCVTTDPAGAERAGLVVCGPASVEHQAKAADRVPVVALSLRPLGGRFAELLPTGMTAIRTGRRRRRLLLGAVVSLMGLAVLVYVVRRPAVRMSG